ncbi:MAG: DUF6404 family protein [Rhodoferax sp.]
MTYPAKVAVALETLQATGIWRSNYAPPIHRLLWRMGVAVPPPHLASFALNLVVSAVWFGTFWGLLMWLALWSRQGMPGVRAVGLSAVAGVAFGFFMAVYYWRGARKHNLPRWSQVKTAA